LEIGAGNGRLTHFLLLDLQQKYPEITKKVKLIATDIQKNQNDLYVFLFLFPFSK